MENKGLLKLPETWHIKVDEINKSVLEKWFKKEYPQAELPIGFLIGKAKHKEGKIAILQDDVVNSTWWSFGQEITFADFKRLVLGEKNSDDYGVAGCEELAQYCKDNNMEFISGRFISIIYFYNGQQWIAREFNISNRQTLPLQEYLKLIEPETMEEMDFRCGKASAEFDKKGTETLIKRIEKRGYTVTKNNSKEIEKTMEKKYEYKLRDEKHKKAVEELGDFTLPIDFFINKNGFKSIIEYLERLNVLDLFFEKIEVKELPIIGGSKPIISEDGDLIEIAGFQIDMYIIDHFKSFTLGNDIHVSESDIKQIREYLRK